MGTKTEIEISEDGNKVAKSTRRPVFIDNEIFTFAPKVSSKSVKIAQSLGTDFMSRQQQHLERQKRNVRRSTFLHVQYTAQFSYGSSRHIDTSLTLASFFTMHVITICQKVRMYYSCPKMLIAKRKSACHNCTPKPTFQLIHIVSFSARNM